MMSKTYLVALNASIVSVMYPAPRDSSISEAEQTTSTDDWLTPCYVSSAVLCVGIKPRLPVLVRVRHVELQL